MAVKRTNEAVDELDLDEWEDEYGDDQELDGANDDEDFSYESLSTSEKKRYDKLKKQIEDSLVDQLSKGDTNSPVYKGMQRVVASKDNQLRQYQQALAGVIQRVQEQEVKGGEIEFLKEIVQDMLDDDSRKIFSEKYERFNEKQKGSRTEQMLAALLQQQQGQQQWPAYGQVEEDPQITQYRKEATNKLKAFAKRMGADPEKDELDFGDESEPLLSRMDKLAASIERAATQRDEQDVDSVRRRRPNPNTRTRNESAFKDSDSISGDVLEKASMALLRKMRQN